MGISKLTAILCFVLHRLKGSTRVTDNKETIVFFPKHKCLEFCTIFLKEDSGLPFSGLQHIVASVVMGKPT